MLFSGKSRGTGLCGQKVDKIDSLFSSIFLTVTTLFSRKSRCTGLCGQKVDKIVIIFFHISYNYNVIFWEEQGDRIVWTESRQDCHYFLPYFLQLQRYFLGTAGG